MGWEKFIDDIKKKQTPYAKGGGSAVYEDPHNDGRIIKVHNEGDVEGGPALANHISNFYVAKIVDLLFPDSNARIHAVTTSPVTSVKEKISLSPLTENGSRDLKEMDELTDKVAQIGIRFDNEYLGNFRRRPDGQLVHVDDPNLLSIDLGLLKNEIQVRLKGSDAELALGYVKRIEEIRRRK